MGGVDAELNIGARENVAEGFLQGVFSWRHDVCAHPGRGFSPKITGKRV